MAYIGSVVFYAWLCLITPVFSLVACLIAPLPPLTRYRVISLWSRLTLTALRCLCFVRYRVIGLENIPAMPAVFLSRHESAWETIAYQSILPPQAFVMKRQLLRIPFFGWGLRQMSPIAIERADGRRALRELRAQGCARLAAGFSVVIFPEGTRMPPGVHRRYFAGGAWLAKTAGAPAVPVAVNSGHCWPKNGFFKRPGLISVVIGEAIETRDKTADEINAAAKAQIGAMMARLGERASS